MKKKIKSTINFSMFTRKYWLVLYEFIVDETKFRWRYIDVKSQTYKINFDANCTKLNLVIELVIKKFIFPMVLR